MKIYLAGGSGYEERERVWLKLISKRLLSFFEIFYNKNDTHFQRRAFELIKKR